MSASLTVLEIVLKRDGIHCRCKGACGIEHPSKRCGLERSERRELLAAPYPLPLTEHETAAARVEDLRPWCPGCWRRAKKRNAEIAAELRRQELHEAQTALPMDLFGVEAVGGGR
ncbi:hypothetical protein [Streptomyces nitrosporeus]|uniref:hypothetical protein n=1 Tax=Streptomyces nitrosporeus TaxID=28894 RepID=UPI00167C9446|nr:hypothetical protein [Streptomyces nitrosporeus]GGZ29785.1 hypothetical protein GCM10010327_70060 [Streptomyces nitrosporeus]